MHQWGIDYLKLPEAWEYGLGTALLTAVETGMTSKSANFEFLNNYRPQLSTTSRFDNVETFNMGLDGCLRFSDITGGCVFGYKENIETNLPPPENLYHIYSHAEHVSGIMAAGIDNGGVVGSCPNCSFFITSSITNEDVIEPAIVGSIGSGAQVVNMSISSRSVEYDLPNVQAAANSRDVFLVAASGNGKRRAVAAPAREPGVFAVGGMQLNDNASQFWDEYELAPLEFPGCMGIFNDGCGSNWQDNGTHYQSDVLAPAARILSTMSLNQTKGTSSKGCVSTLFPAHTFLGVCTGTSMSAPFVTGIAGLVRSLNPLLSNSEVKIVLKGSRIPLDVSSPNNPNNVGVIQADTSVEHVLGIVNGAIPELRLTPLLSLRSDVNELSAGRVDWLHTSKPQVAMAALSGELYFAGEYPTNIINYVPSVFDFPGAADPDLNTGSDVPDYFYPDSSIVTPLRTAIASMYLVADNPYYREAVEPLTPLYRLTTVCPDRRTHGYASGNIFVAVGSLDYLIDGSFNCDNSNPSLSDYRIESIEGYLYKVTAVPQT